MVGLASATSHFHYSEKKLGNFQFTIVMKHFHFIIKMKQPFVLTINNQKLLLLEIIEALTQIITSSNILFHMKSELKCAMPFHKVMRFRNIYKKVILLIPSLIFPKWRSIYKSRTIDFAEGRERTLGPIIQGNI